MKTKKNVAVTVGLLIGFVAGLMVGLTLTNPGLSLMEATGTIGKIDKYRNVRVTEQDIELRNELLADESLRLSYRNYLLYEYASNVKMADDIQFSLEVAYNIPGFRSDNAKTLESLENYAMFLDNARLQLLEAIATIEDLSPRSQIAIRAVLNDAGNALAQTTYRSNVLFDFISAIERFFDTGSKEDFPHLARSHDLLFANLLSACIINDNRPVLEHLVEKELLTEDESLALGEQVLKNQTAADVARLGPAADLERLQDLVLNSDVTQVLQGVSGLPGSKLGAYDSQSLGVLVDAVLEMSYKTVKDKDRLGSGPLAADSEMLKNLLDAKEHLNVVH